MMIVIRNPFHKNHPPQGSLILFWIPPWLRKVMDKSSFQLCLKEDPSGTKHCILNLYLLFVYFKLDLIHKVRIENRLFEIKF